MARKGRQGVALILPLCEIQSWFGISLNADDSLNYDDLKKYHPAVYWQLYANAFSSRAPRPQVSIRSALKKSGINLHRRRLMFQGAVFSEIIFIESSDELSILYVQLIPVRPDTLPENNKTGGRVVVSDQGFIPTYERCYQSLLNHLVLYALESKKSSIYVELHNNNLVSLYYKLGFEPDVKKENGVGLRLLLGL